MELKQFKQICEEITNKFKEKAEKIVFQVDKLIEILENDPRLIVKHKKEYYKIEFAPREFTKKYNRTETNKGWALYNEIKAIWVKSTDKPWNDVRISVFENYVEIRK